MFLCNYRLVFDIVKCDIGDRWHLKLVINAAAACAEDIAAPIWPHGIGCPQQRVCESGLFGRVPNCPSRQIQGKMSDYLRSALGYLNGGTGGNEYVGQMLDINNVKLRVTRLIAEGESIISGWYES